MRNDLAEIFRGGNITPCLASEERTDFFIDDDHPTQGGRSYIVDYEFADEVKELLFNVGNPKGKPIHFLAIDRCLIGRAVQQDRSDFMLFDETTVSFVEMKMKTIIEEEGLSTRDLRVKASNQILATNQFFITRFETAGKKFDYPDIEGIIAVPPSFPKSNPEEKKFREEFLTKNKIELYIQQRKDY
jgi:hypothetical protein